MDFLIVCEIGVVLVFLWGMLFSFENTTEMRRWSITLGIIFLLAGFTSYYLLYLLVYEQRIIGVLLLCLPIITIFAFLSYKRTNVGQSILRICVICLLVGVLGGKLIHRHYFNYLTTEMSLLLTEQRALQIAFEQHRLVLSENQSAQSNAELEQYSRIATFVPTPTPPQIIISNHIGETATPDPYAPTNTPTPSRTPTTSPQIFVNSLEIVNELNSNGQYNTKTQLSIDDMGMGTLDISVPLDVQVGYPYLMEMSLTPDGSVITTTNVSLTYDSRFSDLPDPESLGHELVYEITDRVQLYPVMRAEIIAPSFQITPTSSIEQPIISNYLALWSWIIIPTRKGEQLIKLKVTTPVQIEDYIGTTYLVLKEQNFMVNAIDNNGTSSFAFPQNWQPIVVALVPIILALSAWINNLFKARYSRFLDAKKQLTEKSRNNLKIKEANRIHMLERLKQASMNPHSSLKKMAEIGELESQLKVIQEEVKVTELEIQQMTIKALRYFFWG